MKKQSTPKTKAREWAIRNFSAQYEAGAYQSSIDAYLAGYRAAKRDARRAAAKGRKK